MSVVGSFFKDELRLPGAPEIVARLLGVTAHGTAASRQLVKLVESTPDFAPRVVRLTNGVFYSNTRQVQNLEEAINVFGVNAVRYAALAIVIPKTFEAPRGSLFDSARFWRRAITSAVACELIATAVNLRNDATFLTGLVQDIGVAALLSVRTEDYLKVLDDRVVTNLPVHELERQMFGFDHQDLGSELLKTWGFPEAVYGAVQYHHETSPAPRQFQRVCAMLRASDRMSAIYYGTRSARNVRTAKELLSRSFGINDDRATLMIDRVATNSSEALSQFSLEPGNIQPFSQTLRQANQELGRLNLSYEMVVMEYKEAKERAELLAEELRKANEKLHDLAFRDGLTGLYNHRYFQEALGRELARAERFRRSLALIMVDIDHFKKINDTHGHQKGDLVLRIVGQEISQRMRRSDLVARYGGDEIAVVLPETPLVTAISMGEVCRAAVERAIEASGVSVAATVSMGLAAYDPMNPLDKDQLIRAADGALYRSKQAGRNRVTA
jgi:diguanylate cyclase (GGDEF)-like protein